jgi:signal transduction histidine kinase
MQVSTQEITLLVISVTLIFLLAPLFLVIYITQYNKRKKRHIEETLLIKQTFETELLKAQIEIKEQTLQTIGSDLHDNIGQLLSLTNITLKSIHIPNHGSAARKIDTATNLTSRSIKELRQLGRILQGEQLISNGLQSAIEQIIEWLHRDDNLNISYRNINPDNKRLDANKELIVFRLFQEIINNAVKHAEAATIFIELTFGESNLSLMIRDNGKGFNMNNILNEMPGMGIYNINKRVSLIMGSAHISSEPGLGTEIRLIIPY